MAEVKASLAARCACVLAAVAGMAVVAAGCSGTSAAGPGSTGAAAGHLLVVGGPAPGSGQSLSGTVTFTNVSGAVVTTPANSSGEFTTVLAPGVYTVTGSSSSINDGQTICTGDSPTVEVKVHETETLDVVCDIR